MQGVLRAGVGELKLSSGEEELALETIVAALGNEKGRKVAKEEWKVR